MVHMDTLGVDTISCKCVFPCTPTEPQSKVPIYAHEKAYIDKNIQLHCALEEETDCNFQSTSRKDLEKHIQLVHRIKSNQQPDNSRQGGPATEAV